MSAKRRVLGAMFTGLGFIAVAWVWFVLAGVA